MTQPLLEGRVVHKSSRTVRVATSRGVLDCVPRGKLRRGRSGRSFLSRSQGSDRGPRSGLPVVVGDRVRVRPAGEGEAILEEILPRRNDIRRAHGTGERQLSAHAPLDAGRRGSRPEQVVVAANVDRLLAVLSARLPPPRWALLDRMLVSARWEDAEPGICLNKWDQVEGSAEAPELEELLQIYRDLGYPVFRTSATAGSGLAPLGEWLAGKTTVLAGHSGVGKSSLLLALLPGAEAAVGEVSRATGRGRHVTSAARLYELPGGGSLVDTPGFREYGLVDLEPPQLGLFYPEFEPHLRECRFGDCLHREEPGCAVRRAVEEGRVTRLRYHNYLQVLGTLSG